MELPDGLVQDSNVVRAKKGTVDLILTGSVAHDYLQDVDLVAQRRSDAINNSPSAGDVSSGDSIVNGL